MERKQGFFSALKEEVVRGLSPARSRAKSPARTGSPMSGLLRRRKHHHHHVANPEPLIGRSGSLRPVMEGPDPDGGEIGDSKRGLGLGQWMKGQLSRTPSVASNAYKRSDLRLLLGVLGAPLSPVQVSTNDPLPHLCIKDTPIALNLLKASLITASALNVKSLDVPIEDSKESVSITHKQELYQVPPSTFLQKKPKITVRRVPTV